MLFIVQSFIFTVVVSARFQAGLALFLLMITLAPRSASLAIGPGGFAFSFTRYALVLLISVFAFRLFVSKVVYGNFKFMLRYEAAFWAVFALSLLKLVASVYNSGGSNLLYVFDDFAASLVVFSIFYVSVSSILGLERTIKYLLVGLGVTCLFALLEFALQKPMILFFVDADVVGTERVSEGFVRDDVYRLQALFDNPLLMAEYVLYATPFALFYFFTRRGLVRIISGVLLAGALFLVYGSGSRAGLGVLLLITVPVYLFVSFGGLLGRFGRRAVLTIVVVSIMVAVSLQFSVFMDYAQTGVNAQFHLFEEKERSSLERASQYFIVFEGIWSSPLLGFGVRQNLTNEIEFLNKLDSYWLRMILEGGLFAPVLFVVFWYLVFRRVALFRYFYDNRRGAYLEAAFVSLFVGFFVYKFFISIPFNNIYFYALAGCCLAVTAKFKKGLPPNACPSCP